tara:strand:+ start:421 stop:522 length:102 start_codon:yes stop_codon:yes gene_type:complete
MVVVVIVVNILIMMIPHVLVGEIVNAEVLNEYI